MRHFCLLVVATTLAIAGSSYAKPSQKHASGGGWSIHKSKDALTDEVKCSIDSTPSHGRSAGANDHGLIFIFGENAILTEYRLDNQPLKTVPFDHNPLGMEMTERGFVSIPWSEVGDAKKIRIRPGSDTTYEYSLVGVTQLIEKSRTMGCPY